MLVMSSRNLSSWNKQSTSLLPAIFEELFFRGVIQQELNQWWGNYHLAIVVTAIVFSAIHMQFVTFLPRFLLGMVLGYLLVWGKTILVTHHTHIVIQEANCFWKIV